MRGEWPAVVGAAMLVAAFMTMTLGTSPLVAYFSHQSYVMLLFPIFVGLLGSSALVMVLGAILSGRRVVGGLVRSAALESLGCALVVAGVFCCSLGLLSQSSGADDLVGALLGCGFCLLACCAGAALAKGNARTAPLAAFGIGAVAYSLGALLPVTGQVVAVLVEAVLGSFLVAVSRMPHGSGETTDGVGSKAAGVQAVLAVAAVAICSFISGLTWDPSLAFIDMDAGHVLVSTGASGVVLAALAVLLRRRALDHELSHDVWDVGLPVCVAFVMAVPSLEPLVSGMSKTALDLMRELAFLSCYGLAWGQVLSALAPSGGQSAAKGVDGRIGRKAAFLVAPVAAIAFGVLAGLLLIPQFGEAGRNVSLVVSVVYLVACFLALGRHSVQVEELAADQAENAAAVGDPKAADESSKGVSDSDGLSDSLPARDGKAAVSSADSGPAGGSGSGVAVEEASALKPAAADGLTPFERRCAGIGQEYGLSPREQEVFERLARGHSPAFIAQQLCVSDSTVRTHVRSIYRKLSVRSREEIVSMFDDQR